MTLAADIDPPHAAPSHHDTDTSGAEMVFWALPTVLLALVLGVKTWGLVALTLPALVMVAVMFVIIIWITLP
ncbi:hypothetical protein LHP98_11240 [Rhodobacter sp. Har01]|uniref:hypothetical protein n=1 Tax=Rhodobacter sp. Har01 TaxID=2883999 RepID=UPI001D089993|nr:hypothetical protein [Rhodobacter sp. Har01]MCB6178701.1 hypothetical protein [Rhodobacter sp. Har01]